MYIWNKRKSLPSYLFFIFRYLTPIVSLINLIALNDPGWVGPTCNNWIWLPVAVGPIVSAATGSKYIHCLFEHMKSHDTLTVILSSSQVVFVAKSVKVDLLLQFCEYTLYTNNVSLHLRSDMVLPLTHRISTMDIVYNHPSLPC